MFHTISTPSVFDWLPGKSSALIAFSKLLLFILDQLFKPPMFLEKHQSDSAGFLQREKCPTSSLHNSATATEVSAT